jgi:hypothetical protein
MQYLLDERSKLVLQPVFMLLAPVFVGRTRRQLA